MISSTHVCALSFDGVFCAPEGMEKATGKISKWLTLVSLEIGQQYVFLRTVSISYINVIGYVLEIVVYMCR